MGFGINKELPALAIMTAIGYVCCYMFQIGMLTSYGIPGDLASVDINSLLLSVFILAMLSFVIILPTFTIYKVKQTNLWRILAASYILLLTGGISWYMASFLVGYYDFDENILPKVNVYLYTFLFVLSVATMVLLGFFFYRKHMYGDSRKVIPRRVLYFVVSVSLVFIPSFSGVFYSKVSMATSFYKDSDYFFLLENSKGIVVVSCSERNGVSYKRVDSTDAEFSFNYNPEVLVKVRSCISKWNNKQRKVSLELLK